MAAGFGQCSTWRNPFASGGVHGGKRCQGEITLRVFKRVIFQSGRVQEFKVFFSDRKQVQENGASDRSELAWAH